VQRKNLFRRKIPKAGGRSISNSHRKTGLQTAEGIAGVFYPAADKKSEGQYLEIEEIPVS
jgi:hypothetical protein